jgi:hypothetical protein
VRDLRLFAIATALRPLAGAGGSPLASGVGRLATAGRGAIDRGAAAAQVEPFAATMAQVARAMRTAAAGNEAGLTAELETATGRLDGLGAAGRPAGVAAPAAPPRPRTTRPIRALAEVPQEAAPAPSGDNRDLAAAYATMERLIAERGLPLGSLEELLGAPVEAQPAPAAVVAPPAGSRPVTRATAPTSVSEADVVPIESLAPDEPESPVVPIETLLFHGQDALRRALELKADIAALAAAPGGASPRLNDLQREVFDLIELGLGAQP